MGAASPGPAPDPGPASSAGHGAKPAKPAEPAAPQASPVGPGLLNIANVLTVIRILLVPVFVVFMTAGGTGWRLAALAVFCVASLTDFVDGKLARSRGLVTDFGKIADPIADKALTGAALITLSALGELPGWVTGLILLREVGITVMRFVVIRRGVIAASQGGKLKTLLQIAAICLYILPPSAHVPSALKIVVMAAAVVVTLVTGADYVIRAVRLGRTPALVFIDTREDAWPTVWRGRRRASSPRRFSSGSPTPARRSPRRSP